MNRRRPEVRVLDVVDRAMVGGRVEDDLVECKSACIDAAKAARRLAGQPSAARGDVVASFVGLDEKAHSVVPLDATDPAVWVGRSESVSPTA